MLFQVIHCHPLADSYNHALFRAIVETLEQRGHEVVATDLYREGFAPALTPAERVGYFTVPYDASAVAAYADVLRRVQGLILCFPQWWFSMPAMLTGYFDRVWAPGVAFAHDPAAAGGIRPLLTHVQVFGVVTSYGAPWWVARFVAGDPARKILMRTLKPMCGRRVRSFYLAHYRMDRSTPSSREAFLVRVRRQIARL
jgi:NAD(P)H dehydrogenase (quinone)